MGCHLIMPCIKIQKYPRNLHFIRRFTHLFSQGRPNNVYVECISGTKAQYFLESHGCRYRSFIGGTYGFAGRRDKTLQMLWNTCTRQNFTTCSKLNKSDILSSDGSNTSLFHLRYLFVKACESQWEDIPEGVTFDVAYADTHPGESYDPTRPVIVGIHGVPGSHNDFLPILEPLAAKGYRVIIPNFPGYSYTTGVGPGHDDCFSHSAEEKAELLANFLTELGIPSVDLMVSHSAGSYPVIHLCSQFNSVRSAMLICPGGHVIYRGIRPFFLLKALSRWWDTPMLRPYIKLFIWLASIPTGFWKFPPAHLAESVRSLTNIDFEQAGSCLVTIELKKVPCCVVFTDNDPFVERSIYRQINELLGISDRSIVTYSQDGSREPEQDVEGSPKGVLLRQGGHNPMKKYSNIIADELQKLLQQIWRGKL